MNAGKISLFPALIAFVLLQMVTVAPAAAQKAESTEGDAVLEHADGEHDYVPSIEKGGKVVWTCSMHPQIRLPEPGKCPICFMDLIPIEVEDKGKLISLRQVSLNERERKLAEIAVAPAKRQDVEVAARMVGKMDYDETRLGSITAWMPGRIDRLYVDYTGAVVKRGQAMARIYSPELVTAQAELVQAAKALKDADKSTHRLIRETASRTLEAARRKLRLLGLTKSQITAVEQKGTVSEHITLYAPMSGVVLEKNVVEGMYVKTGTVIYTLADLAKLWVILEAYESDLPWIKSGQKVRFEAEAFPGQNFQGTVVYIDPIVNENTRTVRLRLEVDNKSGKLKPGMFVRATQELQLSDTARTPSPLVIPASAPLHTGKRAVVYVAVPKKTGVYEGREVVLGPRAGDNYIVKSGLKEGEMVVVKGNFKIDSAVQITAKPSMMSPGGGEAISLHDHGANQNGREAHDATPAKAAYDAPELFLSRLAALEKEFMEMSEAVDRKDMASYRDLAGKFSKTLTAVTGKGLEGEAKLTWKELSMLLRNDAVLASEASSYERAWRVHKEMSDHFARLPMAFAFRDVLGSSLAQETPESFKKELGIVYGAYAGLKEALAADDLKSAKAAAAETAHLIRNLDSSELPLHPKRLWQASREKMLPGLSTIAEADDLDTVRKAFGPVSDGLIAAVKELGVEMEGPLFIQHCPMAFEGEGGDWLAHDEAIRNPYFGEIMLDCGETTLQIQGP